MSGVLKLESSDARPDTGSRPETVGVELERLKNPDRNGNTIKWFWFPRKNFTRIK